MTSTTKSSSGLSKAEEGLSSRLKTLLWVGFLILALLSSLLLTNAARAQQSHSGQWLISQSLSNARPQAEVTNNFLSNN